VNICIRNSDKITHKEKRKKKNHGHELRVEFQLVSRH
jgi:hypothetical protein